MSVKNYFDYYRNYEPVNENQFMKKRKVYIKFNNKFFDKLLIDEGIKNLPHDIRSTVHHILIEDRSVQETANIMGVHRNTVSNRLKKAKSKIVNMEK